MIDETRVWTVMTPEEGSFQVDAQNMGVAPNGDRYLYDTEGEVVAVFPAGFAVWFSPEDEEDDD